MKKVLIFCSFFFLLGNISFSQSQWSVNSTGSNINLLSSIFDPSDGSTVSVGRINSGAGTEDDCYIVKVGSTGIIKWQRRLINNVPNNQLTGANECFKKIIRSSLNNEYIVVGNYSRNGFIRGIVCRINASNGNEVWSRISNFNTTGPTGSLIGQVFNDVIETGNGNIAIAGARDWRGNAVGSCKGQILLLDRNGNELWYREHSNTNGTNDHFISLHSINNNLVVVGMTDGSNQKELSIGTINEINPTSSPLPIFRTFGINEARLGYNNVINSLWPYKSILNPIDNSLTIGAYACTDWGSTNGLNSILNYNANTLTGSYFYHVGTTSANSVAFSQINNNDYLIGERVNNGTNSTTYFSRFQNNNLVPFYDRVITNTQGQVGDIDVLNGDFSMVGTNINSGYIFRAPITLPIGNNQGQTPCAVTNSINAITRVPFNPLVIGDASNLTTINNATTLLNPNFNDPNAITINVICGNPPVPCPIDSTNDKNKCINQSLQLNTYRTGNTYSWSPSTGLSATNIANPICTANSNTTYTVTITNTVTTCSYKDIINVVVNPGPISNIRDTIVCLGDSVKLSAPTSSPIPYTYSWSPATNISNTTISNPTVWPSVSTNYIVTISNSLGCSTKDTVFVTVKNCTPLCPKDTSSSINKCFSIDKQLSNYIRYGTSYSWSPSTGLSSTTIQNPTTSVNVNTNYIVTITNAATNCIYRDTLKVFVRPLPTSNIKDTIICKGDTIQVNGTPPYAYLWQGQNIEGINSWTALAWPATTTTYIVPIYNQYYCTINDTFQITVKNCHCEDSCNWSLTGNSSVQPYSFIGSINNADFKIRTSNAQRMVVKANGNVGINIAAPTKTLDVNGEAVVRSLPASLPNDKLVLANTTGELKSLAPGGTNQYLSGNGTWQTLPPSGGGSLTAADQGVTLDGNTVQLGDNCGGGRSPFKTDREININNQNLYFNTSRAGKIYMGSSNSKIEYCKQLNARLEINSAGLETKNDYVSPNPSPSGLRFTNLTTADEPIDNKSKGVLSLDEDGDVIWVKACCDRGGIVAAESKSVTDRLDKLEAELKSLKTENTSLKNQLNQINVTLDFKNNVLEQNVPNPFTESTIIGYNIVNNFSKAEIVFSTMKGEVIKTVQLKNAGKGQINVAASFIAKGVYSYSLIVDGKLVETMKMIKQ
jgi:hypothetical protein